MVELALDGGARLLLGGSQRRDLFYREPDRLVGSERAARSGLLRTMPSQCIRSLASAHHPQERSVAGFLGLHDGICPVCDGVQAVIPLPLPTSPDVLDRLRMSLVRPR